MRQVQAYAMLKSCVDLLEDATSQFTKCIPMPACSSVPRDHFVFKNPDQREYVTLRCVRIVSGFNASLTLLNIGYTQEVGVILRTLLEFIHDIDFILEGFVNKNRNKAIQNKVNIFFSEEYKNTQQLLKEAKKQASVPRKKIYAAIGRMFDCDNPHRTRQVVKALEDLYSGYVHGNYHHTMETWNNDRQCYEMKGQPNRILQWLNYMSLIVHPALNVFSTVSSAFSLNQLVKVLIEKRIELDSSFIYKRE